MRNQRPRGSKDTDWFLLCFGSFPIDVKICSWFDCILTKTLHLSASRPGSGPPVLKWPPSPPFAVKNKWSHLVPKLRTETKQVSRANWEESNRERRATLRGGFCASSTESRNLGVSFRGVFGGKIGSEVENNPARRVLKLSSRTTVMFPPQQHATTLCPWASRRRSLSQPRPRARCSTGLRKYRRKKINSLIPEDATSLEI